MVDMCQDANLRVMISCKLISGEDGRLEEAHTFLIPSPCCWSLTSFSGWTTGMMESTSCKEAGRSSVLYDLCLC